MTLIKRRNIFSFSYDFFDESGGTIASVEVPFMAKLLKSNSAEVIIAQKSYLLVSAITEVDGHIGGGQRSVDTYLEIEGKRLAELTYLSAESNEHFVIHLLAASRKLEVKSVDFATFTISEGKETVGTLVAKDLLMRKARIEMQLSLPSEAQVLIFWGARNPPKIV